MSVSNGYPRFSSGEMERRRQAVAGVMDDIEVDHLIVYGAERSGSGVQWLSAWP